MGIRKRPCRNARCPELVESGYCEICQQRQSKKKIKSNGWKKKIYNSAAWLAVRQAALERDRWQCQECKKSDKIKKAIDVDHMVDLEINPSLAYDLENLQSLCKSCHSKKTHGPK